MDDDAESSEEKEKKVKWDSLQLQLFDGDRLIRTLKTKAPDTTGIYKWTWYMRESGADYPSKTIRKRNSEPGGVEVKPGTYKAVLTFGDQTSEEMITVKSDPRLDVSQQNIDEVYAMSKKLQSMQQTAADAVKQLVESKETAEKYETDLKKLDKEKYKSEIKASKEITKNIDSLIDRFLGKEDKRQGITRNPEITVMQRLGAASGYVRSRQNGITSTEETLVKHAQTDLEKALEDINTFYSSEWSNYEEKMKNLELDPFKETKKFQID